MEIIDYCSKYDKEIKELILELQDYIVSIDKEKYNIITDKYKEEKFKDTMKEVEANNGKIYLAIEGNTVVGFIMAIIIEPENTYDFKVPKSGRITELVVTKKCRANGVGQLLLSKMEKYLKFAGCERILIEVFAYNDLAKNFYYKNGYFDRVIDIMKKL